MAVVAALAVQAVWYGPVLGRARLAEVGPGGLGLRTAPWRTLAITPASCW
jgi:hypothetical protein